MWWIIIPIISVLSILILTIGSSRLGRSHRDGQKIIDVEIERGEIRKAVLTVVTLISLFLVIYLAVCIGLQIVQGESGESIWWSVAFGVLPFMIVWLPAFCYLLGMRRASGRGDD